MGIAPKASPAMDMGTLIHSAVQEGKTPSEGLTAPEKRIVGTILDRFQEEMAENGLNREDIEWEHMGKAIILGIPTVGFWDGLCGDKIIEIKTGSALWTQQKADTHGQLALYALQYMEEKGLFVPDILLFSASTKTGKCKTFKVLHDDARLDAMKRRLDYFWKSIAPYHELRVKATIEL